MLWTKKGASEEMDGREKKIGVKELILIFVMAASFFGYFTKMTESEYALFPKGDSKVYTLMAIHFDEPGAVTEELPSIYSQRLFPAFVAHLLSSPWIDERTARRVTTPNRTQSFLAAPLDRTVRRAWQVSNFVAYFTTLVFLYLTLSHFSIGKGLRFFMLATFSMWFIPLRLYTNWIMMPDPWAFAFLAAGTYFTVTCSSALFLVTIVLGVLSKETLLFLAPTYMWRILAKDGFKLRPLVYAGVIGVVPVAVLIALRLWPYFPSYVLTPNAPREAQAAIEGSGGFLSDYLFILKYHLFYRFNQGPIFFFDSAIVLIGTFAGASCLIIWRIRDTLKNLREMHYWIPFLFCTILIGFNVTRYIIYIFPLVVLFTALVLEKRYTGRRLVYMLLFLTLVTVIHHEAWRPLTAENNLELTLVHQLELASDYGGFGVPLANQYRWLAGLTIPAAFIGFFVLGRIKR